MNKAMTDWMVWRALLMLIGFGFLFAVAAAAGLLDKRRGSNAETVKSTRQTLGTTEMQRCATCPSVGPRAELSRPNQDAL